MPFLPTSKPWKCIESCWGEEHPDVATSLHNLASLHYAQENINLALRFLEEGLEIQEVNLERILSIGSEQQKRQYMQTISWARDASISLHLKLAPEHDQASRIALTTILRRKGRLLDFLTQSQQLVRQSLDPQSQKLLTDLNQTRTAIANIYNQSERLSSQQSTSQLTILTKQEQNLVAQISSHSREFAQRVKPVTLEAIQQRLPEESALIEFFQYRPYNPLEDSWGKLHYAVYILPAQGKPQGIDLGKVETLKPLLERFLLAVQTKEITPAEFKQVAREVDKKLMAQVRSRLGNSRHLLLSPDSDLSIIPFEALVDEKNNYLIETYDFTYLTSGRDLLRFSEEEIALSPPMVFGAPDFEHSGQTTPLAQNEQTIALRSARQTNPSELDLSPLPETMVEVQEIGKMLGVEPLMGEQAHEAALKQVNRPRILHIATHGFFLQSSDSEVSILGRDLDSLLRSGLALAGIKDAETENDLEDGIFTALEAMGLNLWGTKLVVLSACDTGKGNISAGEGIYGLRRALVIAGAESQVISLWRVEDKATKELMVDYYQRLQEKNQGRSQALREVKLSLLDHEDYNHPYYWASFIPSGNWGTMIAD